MATEQSSVEISDEERAADGRADALAAVGVLTVAVLTMLFWVSGQ